MSVVFAMRKLGNTAPFLACEDVNPHRIKYTETYSILYNEGTIHEKTKHKEERKKEKQRLLKFCSPRINYYNYRTNTLDSSIGKTVQPHA